MPAKRLEGKRALQAPIPPLPSSPASIRSPDNCAAHAALRSICARLCGGRTAALFCASPPARPYSADIAADIAITDPDDDACPF